MSKAEIIQTLGNDYQEIDFSDSPYAKEAYGFTKDDPLVRMDFPKLNMFFFLINGVVVRKKYE